MHAVIRHYINDPVKWDRTTKNILSMIEHRSLPRGLKALEYLPSVDGRKADCVWEADSLDALKQFMEHETTGAARNEYFEVKDDSAIGLPRYEDPVLAHAA